MTANKLPIILHILAQNVQCGHVDIWNLITIHIYRTSKVENEPHANQKLRKLKPENQNFRDDGQHTKLPQKQRHLVLCKLLQLGLLLI